ncbi:MAG TPA: protein adenylyltransferase SelO family protein, partial [Burkholderiales bacterium]
NTDNMSILGLTIDYGPYGWLEGYDPQWTPNTTDAHGRRSCYGHQPQIAQWNLARLAEALLPLIAREELEKGLALYAETFDGAWPRALAQKLGLPALDQPGDEELVGELFEALSGAETDFTLFFRELAALSMDKLRRAFYAEPAPGMQAWLERYARRVHGAAGRVERMNRVNPKYVFRNYLAVQAIEALAQGDASMLERLMAVLQRPYDEQPQHDELAGRRPEWARDRPGCSALSCSS